MRSVTLTDALTRIYRRADLENATDRFPTSEVTDEYNESLASLYDRILRARGSEYYEKSTTVTTTSGTSTYNLPSDFMELISAKTSLNGYQWRLERFTREEEPYLASAALGFSGQVFRYMLHGKGTYAAVDTIQFLPTPSPNTVVTLFYVPCAAKLVSGSDTFDGVNGWEEYAILDCAAKLLLKNNKLDRVQTLRAMREEIGTRIDALTPKRDNSGPAHVVDTRGSIYDRRRWLRRPY